MGEFCKNIESQLNQDFINVNVSSFVDVCREIETGGKYSEPMVVIGYYITIASMVCLYAITFDLSYNLRNKKFWFPNKYFSLNAASITIIAVAIKLPMDLSSPMPGVEDQVAKLGGLGFLCVMMSNLMPSLASMDNKSLFSNVTGLSILVISLIVDVGIQIKTQVIFNEHPFMTIACIYMGMLLFLILILISSALAIPVSKKVIEFKFQATLNDQNLQENLIYNVEKLKQLVKKYWIMAETGSPQFVVASTPLSSASGIICAISMVMHISLLWELWPTRTSRKKTNPVYKQSTSLISLIQIVGVVLGSVAPISRCFIVLSFKLFANQNRNHFSVFKVEKYWTQKLCEWKESPLSFFSIEMDHLHNLKNHILIICIGFQKAVVVSCKIIELVPVVVIIFAIYSSCYFKSLKAMLFAPPTASSTDDTNEDLSSYVLLLEDDVSLTKYLVKKILASLNRLIQKAEEKQDKNLLKLVEKSVALDRVDTSVLPVELVNSWSLQIISLTCIAIVIPGIDKDVVDSLFKSVSAGIFCSRIVEESLNTESVNVNIRWATVTLWHDVKNNKKWLENTLERSAYEGKTPAEIVKLFARRAEEIVNEFNRSTSGELVEKENLPPKVIAANSMYRNAQMIMHTYESNNLEVIEDELFTRLSNIIGDILAEYLANIPRVVIMKCHQSVIEKREASVMDAIDLLGRTSEIIRRL